MIRYIHRVNPKELQGTALVRLDLNIEDDPQSHADEWRLEAAIPSIRFLSRIAEKVVIMGHYGRPPARNALGFSLRKNKKVLEQLLKRKVIFIPHFRFPEIRKAIADAPSRSLFLLENIRFLKGETENSAKLARELATLGDYYVNEAFANSHRRHASMAAITKELPSYGGIELEKEVRTLSHVMRRARRPLVVIVGGAKARSKLGLLKSFQKKADWILLGGGAANTLLYLSGVKMGKSLYDRDPKDLKTLRPFLKKKNVVLPADWRTEKGKILDIGARTEKLFAEKIGEAHTVIWSGPLGLIEKKRFARGTLRTAEAVLRNKKAFSLTGGGETVMFLKKHKLDDKFSFISTGGGAMVKFLGGEELPAIKALHNRRM